MRVRGTIDAGSGLGHTGHACRGFDERRELVDAALEFRLCEILEPQL